MFKSIRSKILSAQLFLVVLATFSLGAASFFIIYPYLTSTEQEKCEYIALTWAGNLEHLIADSKDQITLISQSEAVEFYSISFNVGPIRQYLSSFADQFPVIAYINEEGFEEVKLVSGKTVAGERNMSTNIKKALDNPNQVIFQVVSPAIHSDSKQQPPPYLEFTIHNQLFGEFAGIISAQIPVHSLKQHFATFSSFHFEGSGFLALYDLQGTTIAHANPELILTKVNLPLELQDGASSLESTLFQRDTRHGIDGFSAYAPVTGSNLIVAATLPYDQFMTVPNKMKNLFGTIIGIVILLGLLLSAAIARSISKPILKLSHVAQRLAKGEWGQDIETDSKDETGDLGRSFKQMSDDLHQMILTRDSEIELRQIVERQIKRSHLELDQIFNTAAGGMMVISLKHKIIRVNDTFFKMLGFKPQNLVGKNCYDIFPDKTCGTKKCAMAAVIRNNSRIEIETEKKRADGSMIICHLIAKPFHDINGDLIGIIEDFRDITHAKKNAELLKTSEQRYRRLFDSAPDGIAVLNDQGVIIDCNQSLASVYKRARPELIGNHFTSFNTSESTESCLLNFKKIQEIEQMEGEVQLKTPDGNIITVWRKASTIRDKAGLFTGILIYDRDISKQKEIEELREDMTRMSRHDMKTPLNGIINLPHLIKQEKNLSDKQAERLELIEDAGYKLLTMLNSSLDLYKMEEGTYLYNPAPVDLFNIFTKITEALWSEMQENQCELKVFLNGTPTGSTYSFLVQGEELLCYSMLANLLKNAVESSPWAQPISIHLDNSTQPEIQIHNQGQVPAAIHNKFFEKYVTSGKNQGTGLGTYSAKLMAQTMNGDITMTSSPAAGTTVKITMPAASNDIETTKFYEDNPNTEKPRPTGPVKTTRHPVSEDKQDDRGAKTSGKRVLLAEDDPINQALATALLEDKGFLVTLAVNGKEAIELYKEENPFDLILMDMQMPLLNGIEATKFIRKAEETTGHKVPIIAVTGTDVEKNSKVFLEAGGDAIVSKPIQIDLLWETIAKFADASDS